MIRTLLTTSTIALMLSAGAIAQDTTTPATPADPAAPASDTMAPADPAAPATDSMAPASETPATDSMAPADPAAPATDSMAPADPAVTAPATDSMMSTRTTWDWATGYTIGADDIIVNELLGAPVYSSAADDAEEIGSVNDLVITSGGDINAVIIGVGGFLGIGEKNVAVDYASLDYVVAADNTWRWVLGTTREALEAAPEFVWEDPNAPAVDPAMAPADPAAPAAPVSP